MKDSWNDRYISTVARLDPQLADKYRIAGALTTPITGRYNESPEDHAIVFVAYIHHLRADAEFRAWITDGTTLRVPRGSLAAIIRLANPTGKGAIRTGFSDKQMSNIVRLHTRRERAVLRGTVAFTK